MYKLIVLNIIITLLICTIVYYSAPVRVVTRHIEVPVFVQPSPPPPPPRTPEFRPPPLREWRPPVYQQMGLLKSSTGDVLPLYGRESRTHRDRFYYYTTTPGEQVYPLPIEHKNQECSQDIGCPEFYGNETVTVFSKDDPYTVKIYPNRQFNQ